MPRGPESFGGGGERNESDELRSEYQARGDEANRNAINAAKKEQEKNFDLSPAAVLNKLKKNPTARRVVGSAALVAATGIMVASIITINITKAKGANNSAITNAPSAKPKAMTEAVMTPIDIPGEPVTISFENENENTQFAGETINGVKYDYTEYADRDNKEAYNAYGYDYSDQYDNREKATEGIMHMAEQEPEALASYAYNIFTDDEKQELGIKGLSMVEIDNKFDEAGGGALQQNLKDKLGQVLKDEKTSFKFYHEDGTEETSYIYFVDENEDGNYSPDELHLGYDTKKRNGAPQVDISRTFENPDGTTKTQKMMDLNMQCGYQVNYKKGKAPVGLPQIPSNKPVPTVISGGGPGGGGGTPPNPVPPDPNPVPPDPDPKPTPTPTPTINPKDVGNHQRIEDKNDRDTAGDLGTGRFETGGDIGQTPGGVTNPPAGDTNPVAPNPSGGEEVQPTAPENDYGGEDNLGGDTGGQEEADAGEQNDVPTGPSDAGDALGDLGIE